MGARLNATARHTLRDNELAADCVHDVFLRLWRQGTSYAPQRGSLEAFLDWAGRYRDLGFDEVVVHWPVPDSDYDYDVDVFERVCREGGATLAAWS